MFEKPLNFLQLLQLLLLVSHMVLGVFYSYSLFSCLFFIFIKSVLRRFENESSLFCSFNEENGKQPHSVPLVSKNDRHI